MFKFLRFLVNCEKKADAETDKRRKKLQSFAKSYFNHNDRCEILASIIEHGIEPTKDLPHPSRTLIADLKAVLIGGI